LLALTPLTLKGEEVDDSGRWHHIRMCPREAFANGVRVLAPAASLSERGRGRRRDDDVLAIREIALSCLSPDARLTTVSTHSDLKGEWTDFESCDAGTFIKYA